MAHYQGINHLALVTRDMDRTIRFWRDLLGMRLIAGLGSRRYRHYFFEISKTDLIAFFEWPDVTPVARKDHGVPVRGPLAFDHVAVGVAGAEDLWELKDKLEAAGFWVSEVMDHGFIHSIYTFDPNEIPIEFSAPVKTVDLGQSPQMADRNPCQAALEGADPQPGQWPPVISPTPVVERWVYPGEGVVLRDGPAT